MQRNWLRLILSLLTIFFVFSEGYCAADFYGLGKSLYDSGKYEQSAEIFEKSCYYGDSKGCFALAEMYDKEKGIDKDPQKALIFYQKACEHGFNNDNNSCTITGLKYTLLGLSFETGTGFEPNLEKAAEAYRQACRYDNGQGCTNLGRMFEHGVSVQKSPFQASQLYHKGCELNDGMGCYNLAIQFEQGHGVKKDLAKYARYLRISCDLKYQPACEEINSVR